MARDETSLDIFWLKDSSLSNPVNLHQPDELAGDIVENLGAALLSFRSIVKQLV